MPPIESMARGGAKPMRSITVRDSALAVASRACAADLRITPRAGGGRGELARELKRIHADDGVRVVRGGEPGQDAAEQDIGEAERAVVELERAELAVARLRCLRRRQVQARTRGTGRPAVARSSSAIRSVAKVMMDSGARPGVGSGEPTTTARPPKVSRSSAGALPGANAAQRQVCKHFGFILFLNPKTLWIEHNEDNWIVSSDRWELNFKTEFIRFIELY